ncbi:phenylalanine--tRNA ligase subunit alpha [Spiroplasma endosymbiont of Asaphidion curtum]|uniref:phenylalanine--tRNA ligase subunit alpha n=1 Tax=Spiroplasma endosymbiont of Asaphidion curtum TaxID=3066281 RepID=UPI00313BC074
MTEQQLQELLVQAKKEVNECQDLDLLQTLKIKYLGKKSQLDSLLGTMRNLKNEERIALGIIVNVFKKEIISLLETQETLLKQENLSLELKLETIDVSLPVNSFLIANRHPLNLIICEISEIFQQLGYEIVQGQEVDTDEYNFERLNLAKNHPAQEMQDSFYLDSNYLLRTHCTNVTARYLEKYKDSSLPLAIVSTGNVYRRDDDDATHSHQFMQIDGFLVAPNISFTNLKWTLNYLIKRLFKEESKMRLRPSYFPFTEPSVEVDVSCTKCAGVGCNICKHTGWLEILGAGMISPNVFIKNNLAASLQGFAFGIGIERIAMLKYGIEDIRHFYNNDYRFLKQFKNF